MTLSMFFSFTLCQLENVHGPDFSVEALRVLKEKEIRQYGEYRTKRLVMEAWRRMGHSVD